MGLRDSIVVPFQALVHALQALPQLQRIDSGVALEFVSAAVAFGPGAGGASFVQRQISSVLLEFIYESNSAVDQMRGQPLNNLVRQGRAAVVRLSPGHKKGEVRLHLLPVANRE